MANNIEASIRARVDTFVSELTGLVREAAFEAVHEALGDALSAPARRGPGRPRGKTTVKPRAVGKVRRGSRRSASDVGETQRIVVDYVRGNPGCSVTDIAATLGLTTKDLQLPMRKLIADGKLRTTGQRRGTRYHTSRGATASKRAPKKTTKRKSSKKGAQRRSRAGTVS